MMWLQMGRYEVSTNGKALALGGKVRNAASCKVSAAWHKTHVAVAQLASVHKGSCKIVE